MPVKRLIAAELAAGTLIGGTIAAAAPTAHAYPGDPMPGCITQVGSVLCDGPIRPDGTFQRCWENYGISYSLNCEIVDPGQPWPLIPFGAPQYHIA
jgi:hypothetical protein